MKAKAWIRVALIAAAALAATQAEAQFGRRGGQGDFNRTQRPPGEQSPGGEQRAQDNPVYRAEYLLGMLHEDLKLRSEQEPLWQAYADKVNALAGDIARERARIKATLELKALPRIDQAVDVARDRLTALEEISAAAKALHARLTPEQQTIADARLATTLPFNYTIGASAALPDTRPAAPPAH